MKRQIFTWTLFFVFLLFHNLSAAAPDTVLQYLYSTDSDGVKTRSTKISNELLEKSLTYSFFYTRMEQNYQPIVNEYVLVLKWRRDLPGDAGLTFWGGLLSNDLRGFIPAAVMYDKALSDNTHAWFSAGRETIGTVPANQLELYRTNVAASMIRTFRSKAFMKISADGWFYNDMNTEQKWLASYTKNFSKRFEMTGFYRYRDANFTRPGIYWVPQQEHTLGLAPRYTIPVSREGQLAVTFQKALWAQNRSGGINSHEIDVELVWGRVMAGYRSVQDGDYSSHNYRINYKIDW